MFFNGQSNIKNILMIFKNSYASKSQTLFQTQINQFFAMCDASKFGVGAVVLQSHQGTNKKT